MIDFLVPYLTFFLAGLVGSISANRGARLVRIGSYTVLTCGHYLFHYYDGMFYGGGKRTADISIFWWTKEVLVVFPLLGFYNLLLTIYALISCLIACIFISNLFGTADGFITSADRSSRIRLRPWNARNITPFHYRYKLLF